MNLRLAALAVALLAPAAPLGAQSAEDDVLAVVNQMFDGMRKKDTTMVRTAFHPNARMVTFAGDSIAANTVDGFVDFIGRPNEQIWNEPIFDTEIRIDGNLATVWTKYVFFRGPNGDLFNHCGVDAFLLHRGAAGWKISVLTDTRREEPCEMPPGY